MRRIKNYLLTILKSIKRIFFPVKWYDLRILNPISRKFGLDRGTPIDRYYIEEFLKKNQLLIKGRCCEISENFYLKKFATKNSFHEVFDYNTSNKNATIVGDLTKIDKLPNDLIDCFILTQTLNFIFDYQSAVAGIHKMLKKGGVALVTVSGISQISKYDYDRWGDYWRFTDKSIKEVFCKVFKKKNIEIKTYGNVLSSTCFLHGISAEELTHDELMHNDINYQITITIKATK